MDVGKTFSNMWNDVVRTTVFLLPRIVAFLVILGIGYLIAKVLEKATHALLEKVGFDRAVERGGVGQALERTDYDATDIASRVIFFGAMLITLIAAFNVFGPNAVSDMLASILAWLPKLFVGIVLVVVAAFIANLVRDILNGVLAGLSFGKVLATAAWAFIIGLGVIAALGEIGVAAAVTMPLLLFVLATIGGIAIVGVGGSLVRPMQPRWEEWLSRAEAETRAMRLTGGADRRRVSSEDVMERMTGGLTQSEEEEEELRRRRAS